MTEIAQDKRRAVVRVTSAEVLKCLTASVRLAGGDTISTLVFTGVWVANVQHLTGESDRYAAFQDIPPDSQRRPVTEEDLERLICIPQPILGQYVRELVADGTVERRDTGLVVPSAVFTRREQLATMNETYARILNMVSAMRAVGFRFGQDEAPTV